MPLLPSTAATGSRALKRNHEEEHQEPSKRQHQNKLDAPSQHQSDLSDSDVQALLNFCQQSSSPPSVNFTSPNSPTTHLSNTQETNTGYDSSQDGVYTPGSTYGNLNEQCGCNVSSQSPPISPQSYGNLYHSPEYYPNGQSSTAIHSMYAPGPPISQALQPSTFSPTSGEQSLQQNNPIFTTAAQDARKRLFAEQVQWIRDVRPSFKEWPVQVIPGIPLQQETLAASMGTRTDLLPHDVWRLRALSPFQRYSAYRGMLELTYMMLKYDQITKEFQDWWLRIVEFRTYLMQYERVWAMSFQRGTCEDNWARWTQTLHKQVVETQVDQAMVVEYLRTHSNAQAMPFGDVSVVDEMPQPLASEPAPAPVKKKPATKKKAKPQAEPVATSAATTKVRPDKIKHPQDQVKVPEYPSDDINDFEPDGNGRYKCMHEYEKNMECCRIGLTKKGMKQALGRRVQTWRARVEVLIENGLLHKSHQTWKTNQNARLRAKQKVAEESRKGQDGQEQQEKKAPKRKQRRQQWKQASPEVDPASELPSVPVSTPPEQQDAPAPAAEPSSEEVAAAAAAHEHGISEAMK
jgi:hypothetical protein